MVKRKQKPLAGEFSHAGGKTYKESNQDIVHPDNFMKLYDGRELSKMVFGTSWPRVGQQGDFFQYLSLKHALLSGGVNHIDTGSTQRQQDAERVVGQVLQTVTQKYGYGRD